MKTILIRIDRPDGTVYRAIPGRQPQPLPDDASAVAALDRLAERFTWDAGSVAWELATVEAIRELEAAYVGR